MLSKRHENLLDQVVEAMKKEKKEITRTAIGSYVMTQVIQHGYLGERLGRLSQGPIYAYCEEKGIK